MPRSKPKKLTEKQIAFVKELYSGEKKSHKEKGVQAGYTGKNANKLAYQALNSVGVQQDLAKRIAYTEAELNINFTGIVKRFMKIHKKCNSLDDYNNSCRALENIADLLKYNKKEDKSSMTFTFRSHGLIEKYRREF